VFVLSRDEKLISLNFRFVQTTSQPKVAVELQNIKVDSASDKVGCGYFALRSSLCRLRNTIQRLAVAPVPLLRRRQANPARRRKRRRRSMTMCKSRAISTLKVACFVLPAS
jgi:hypothetical protein